MLIDRQQILNLQGNSLAIKAIPKMSQWDLCSLIEESMVAQKGPRPQSINGKVVSHAQVC